MFIKFEDRTQGKRFTFFKQGRVINGESVNNTDKCVFGTLSEGIKTGENNGKPIYVNDYWNVTFCGKAYEEALLLNDKDRISVVEMNVRNVYVKEKKKSYPQIMVTDFDVISNATVEDEEGIEAGIEIDESDLPFEV